MGDMSEMRGIIVVGTFLGIALTLILLMPPELIGGASETDQSNNIVIQNLMAINSTYMYNFSGLFYRSPNIDIGGWHTCISEAYPIVNGETLTDNTSRVFQFEITDAWYSYFYNREDFRWRNIKTGSYVDEYMFIVLPPASFPESHEWHYVLKLSTIDDYALTNETVFSIVSTRCTMSTYFEYDNTLYDSPTDAYNHTALSMVVAIDFSERNTQFSAWSFVYNLFFFQNIVGLDSTISNLIRIPFMLALGYILFICVLRVIGAVFGGGGA